MRIRVALSAQARVAAGYSERDVELPAKATVLDLLRTLAADGPPDLRSFLFRDEHQVQPTLLLIRNDEAVPRGGAAATSLNDGDLLSIVPPVAGG